MKRFLFILTIYILLPGFVTGYQDRAEAEKYFSDRQTAAIKLGYSIGRKFSLIALPFGLREESFSGLSFGNSELNTFFEKLDISKSERKGILNRMNAALKNTDPISAARDFLKEMNRIKNFLSMGENPELMHVFRIGFVIGYTLETAYIVTEGNPTENHIKTFVALTQKWRSAMAEDLKNCGLPENFIHAIRETNILVDSVDDLRTVMDACKNILTMVEQATEPKRKPADYKEHRHPQGFTFSYPEDWSISDDMNARTVLLMPPPSPGPKAIYLVEAYKGYNDPLDVKSYLEGQLSPARIESFSHEQFSEGPGFGAILYWKVTLTKNDEIIRSGFWAYVKIMKNWAVIITAYGPTHLLKSHDVTIRRVAASFTWR